jgi:hypothetical protein
MVLPDGAKADLGVLRADTGGSRLHLLLTDRSGRPLPVARPRLRVTNLDRGVDNLAIPLTRDNDLWVARYRFPLPGQWKALLTVDEAGGTAVLTTGTFTIRE